VGGRKLTVYQDNKPWAVIKAEWERITGKAPGGSTLAVRYGRLKASLDTVMEDHIPAMMDAEAKTKVAIEGEIKELWAKKWARVAKLMAETGTTVYSVCP
jgi:hypothetical protein